MEDHEASNAPTWEDCVYYLHVGSTWNESGRHELISLLENFIQSQVDDGLGVCGKGASHGAQRTLELKLS